MGCDIHLYSETQINGVWVADKKDTFVDSLETHGVKGTEEYYEKQNTRLEYSYDGRNYALFGLLSEGVRYDTEYAFPTKEIPNDVSPEIKVMLNRWEGDAHSHNIITIPEIKQKLTELLLLPETEEVQFYRETLQSLLSGLPTSIDPDKQRIVFFFDN